MPFSITVFISMWCTVAGLWNFPSYFSVILHLFLIKFFQLFLTYFPKIYQLFHTYFPLISRLFLTYFSAISSSLTYFSVVTHLFLSCFSLISHLFLSCFSIASHFSFCRISIIQSKLAYVFLSLHLFAAWYSWNLMWFHIAKNHWWEPFNGSKGV